VAIAATEIVIPYRIFATYLKALTLVLLAYVVDAFVVNADWVRALRDTIVPQIEFKLQFVTTVVAIFGTTISPYLFFWQTSEEVEEMHERHIATGDPSALTRARYDTNVGMLLAHVVFYFIVLTTAATLHPAGITEINTAKEAAESLRPLAGDAATVLFAIGFIGSGLLAIPVLAGSAAYAVAEVFDWREGLESKPRQAPQFYTVIAVSTLVGLVIAISGVGAIRALFVEAIVNGVVAPVLILAILAVSNDKRVMSEHVNGWLSNLVGVLAALTMGFAAIAMLVALAFRA
jgi:Mn2+/Fe2+ NRAMP family transporter